MPHAQLLLASLVVAGSVLAPGRAEFVRFALLSWQTSGSTMVHHVLDAHPDVYALREFHKNVNVCSDQDAVETLAVLYGLRAPDAARRACLGDEWERAARSDATRAIGCTWQGNHGWLEGMDGKSERGRLKLKQAPLVVPTVSAPVFDFFREHGVRVIVLHRLNYISFSLASVAEGGGARKRGGQVSSLAANAAAAAAATAPPDSSSSSTEVVHEYNSPKHELDLMAARDWGRWKETMSENLEAAMEARGIAWMDVSFEVRSQRARGAHHLPPSGDLITQVCRDWREEV